MGAEALGSVDHALRDALSHPKNRATGATRWLAGPCGGSLY